MNKIVTVMHDENGQMTSHGVWTDDLMSYVIELNRARIWWAIYDDGKFVVQSSNSFVGKLR